METVNPIKLNKLIKTQRTSGLAHVTTDVAHADSSGLDGFAMDGSPQRLRRSWPQRVTAVVCVVVIVSAFAIAYQLHITYSIAEVVGRVIIPAKGGGLRGQPTVSGGGADTRLSGAGENSDNVSGNAIAADRDAIGVSADRGYLRPDTAVGEPVNFLLVGTDSAAGLDPDDPARSGRGYEPSSRSRADTIMLLRLDPASSKAWALSIPRDLRVELPDTQTHRIASARSIGGPARLVDTIRLKLGVEVNHYMEVDFAGFKALVDALGGVPVWFPYPARDVNSGLNITTSGCHTLDGTQALQYVRSRKHKEQIDGVWKSTGASDLYRIKRQQRFLVLALERAVEKGLRNPHTLKSMLESLAPHIVLDQYITSSEIVDLAQALNDFQPDSLHRAQLEVYTVRLSDGGYGGEAAYIRKNQAILDVMRGIADEVRAEPEQLRLVGGDMSKLKNAADSLSDQGFVVSIVDSVASAGDMGAGAGGAAGTGDGVDSGADGMGVIPQSVVLFGAGSLGEAITVARYLQPTPYVVQSERVEGVVAVLGADYQKVRFSNYPSYLDVKTRFDAGETPDVLPDLGIFPVMNPDGVMSPGGVVNIVSPGVRNVGVRNTALTDSVAPAHLTPSVSLSHVVRTAALTQQSLLANASGVPVPPDGSPCA